MPSRALPPGGTFIQNRTFDEIKIGDSAQTVRVLRAVDIQLFAAISGDINPTHLDPDFAHSGQFREIVAHSLWGGTLVSAVLGSELPGPGTVYVSQSFSFRRPVTVGDTLTVTVTCREKHEHNHHIVFGCLAVNQSGVTVMDGIAEVTAPTEKIRRPRILPPDISISDREERFRNLLSLVEGIAPIPAAVACPTDTVSLRSTLLATEIGLIHPILVGPSRKIHTLAEEQGLSLKGFSVVDADPAHAAHAAIALCRSDTAKILIQGDLPIAPFMRTLLSANNGLRTTRQASHAFLISAPACPKLLLLTDAALNVAPTLEEKADILRNALELSRFLGVNEPRVALLAATDAADSADSKMSAAQDAVALRHMASSGQIQGGLLDGPLSLDVAVSPRAALAAGVRSPVTGNADILFVPNIEAGHMMAKQFEYFSGALMGGIVLGTKVPVAPAGHTDTVQTRAVSCIIACLVHHHKQGDFTS